jgi:3-phosphoshikimate 1-carboxyvinyltransferase
MPERAAQVRIGDWVRRRARERPDDLALVDVGTGGGERTWTWRAVSEQADATAMLLAELGVTAGDRVAVQLPNVAEFTLVAPAATRIGAVICPLMPIFRQREMIYMLRHSRRPGARRATCFPGPCLPR